MFHDIDLHELRRLLQSIITEETIENGRIWKLEDRERRRIRRAMFGPGIPHDRQDDLTPPEQRELLGQFSAKVVDPMMNSLPQEIAPSAVLVLYEEFVDQVFIQPYCEVESGGGD